VTARLALLARRKAALLDKIEAPEMARILGLDVVYPLAPSGIEEVNRRHVLAPAFEGGFRFFEPQSNAIAAFEQLGRGFFPISVGWGKTLICLKCADIALRGGADRVLLLVPSQVLNQLIGNDLPWARSRVSIAFRTYVMGNLSPTKRAALIAPQRPGLYVMPYSLLSSQTGEEELRTIAPDLVIADEVHYLSDRTSARTRRLFAFFEETAPAFVGLSGTITDKTLRDYWHLIKFALGDQSPLPRYASEVNDWAAAIDSGAFESPAAQRVLTKLRDWAAARDRLNLSAYTNDQAGLRRAYQLRMNTSPGVVSTGLAEIGTALVLADLGELPPPNEALADLVTKVETLWETPNGDEIEHAIHAAKWLYELSAGFYNELTWPEVETFARRRGIDPIEAEVVLGAAKAHHSAGQEYARALRSWIKKHARPGLDTPFLIGSEMSRSGADAVGADLFDLWAAWKGLDFDSRPDRDSRAVRVCSYKIDAAVKWAQAQAQDKGAILWVYHQEIGRWLAQELLRAGLPVLHCPAGPAHNAAITDPRNVDKLVVASLKAHGTGKNLQHFQHQLFVQWPRNARLAEQVLGRTHRNGQEADELVVATMNATVFDRMAFAACLGDALYIHQSTGNRQKLILCRYDPIPEVFPDAVLRERGFENRLNDDALIRRFTNGNV